MRFRVPKFLTLPGPKELGMSDSDALGLREFTPFQDGVMWEDYDAYVKKHYPVRYFLLDTVPSFWRRKIWYKTWGRVERAWYWVQCHTLKDYKFHLVDLRGVNPMHKYKFGYLDPSDVIELACWAALRRYVEKCQPNDPASWAEPHELEVGGHLHHQKQVHDEVMELYHWWMKGRTEDYAQKDRIAQLMEEARIAHDEKAYHEALDRYGSYKRWLEDHDEEQLLRLVKLRPYLWD